MSQPIRRLPERVKEILGLQLQTLKDPRIGFVTVTSVELSRDNEHAEVFYTVLPDDAHTRERTAAGLSSATPLLRRELGARLKVRKVPTLQFTYDDVPERARRIDEVLERIRAEDRARDEDAGGAEGGTDG